MACDDGVEAAFGGGEASGVDRGLRGSFGAPLSHGRLAGMARAGFACDSTYRHRLGVPCVWNRVKHGCIASRHTRTGHGSTGSAGPAGPRLAHGSIRALGYRLGGDAAPDAGGVRGLVARPARSAT